MSVTAEMARILRMGRAEYCAWLKGTQRELSEAAARGRRNSRAEPGGESVMVMRSSVGERAASSDELRGQMRAAIDRRSAIEEQFSARTAGRHTSRAAVEHAIAEVRAACADRIYNTEDIRALMKLAILRARAA